MMVLQSEHIKHSIGWLIGILISGSLWAQDTLQYDSIIRDWERDLLEVMEERDIAGMSYALFSPDSIIAAQGLGLADVESSRSATDSTLYMIGSVTKLFTTTAILKLESEGKLQLIDPVVKYIPELNKMRSRLEPVSSITIKNLLTHHSGIPSDIFKDLFSADTIPQEHILKQLDGLYLTYPPHFVHSYSNAAFAVLGVIIERVTGKSYESYLRQAILDPLQLNFTSTLPTLSIKRFISSTYSEDGVRQNELHIRDIAAGGLYSNVLDLAHFGQAYLNGSILPHTAIEKALSLQNGDVPLDVGIDIGLTWNISKRPSSGRLYHHSGANLYYRAMFILAPDLDLGVVLLTNSRNGAALLGSCFNLLDDIGSARGVQFTFTEPLGGWDYEEKPKRFKLSKEYLSAITGVYAAPGTWFNVTQKRGKLRTEIDNLKIDLLPIDSNTFIPRYRVLNIFPVRIREIRLHHEILSGQEVFVQEEISGDKSIFGNHLEPYDIPESWINRLGKYEFEHPDSNSFEFFTRFSLSQENGYLIARVKVEIEKEELEFMLVPLNEDAVYLAGLGRYGWYVMQSLGQQDGQPILELYGHRWIRRD